MLRFHPLAFGLRMPNAMFNWGTRGLQITERVRHGLLQGPQHEGVIRSFSRRF